MWFSGAKMPVVLWFFVFAAAWFIIMSLKLDEHGFQLICMKLYAKLWGWVGFDPTKKVNITLPSGEIRHTIMAIVQELPDVQRAWSVATRGLLGAFLVSIFLTIPLTIWFVDFSTPPRQVDPAGAARARSHAGRARRALAEITQHNYAEFVKEARERSSRTRPPKRVLQLPFVERKAGGIHHPYTLAGVPYPHRLEQSHTMLIGTTGIG